MRSGHVQIGKTKSGHVQVILTALAQGQALALPVKINNGTIRWTYLDSVFLIWTCPDFICQRNKQTLCEQILVDPTNITPNRYKKVLHKFMN